MNTDLEDGLGKRSETYLEHIKQMLALKKAGKTVQLWTIDRRRPTTYAIIDDRVLRWQINQIGDREEMKMYGMFIVEDPNQVFIKHFRTEFNLYLNNEAAPANVKTILRS